MLITFKSKAAPEVVMYQEHAKRILDLFHKNLGPGVLTAAETGPALAKLEAEIAASRAHAVSADMQRDVDSHHNAKGDDSEHEAAESVSFSARAFPLLEMLRAAQREGQDIIWGV